jgi:hypothetical protein
MAGLLNVLAMLDVHGVAEQRWLARDTAAPAGAPGPSSPGPSSPGPSGEVPA